MPSLKLSNPFRRGADRPFPKDRAASLKAMAARVMTRKAADPVFSAIDRYQAARLAAEAHSTRWAREGLDALGGYKAANEEEQRLSHAWSQRAFDVLGTAPSTPAGRLALADFVEEWVSQHNNLDGSPQDGSDTIFAEVYPALLKAVRASVGGQGV